MKANQLRIGNWVNAYGKDKQIANGEDICDAEQYSESYAFISITEEWLLKFGFKAENAFYFKTDKFEIGRPDDDIIKGLYSTVINGYYVKLKYIHQLQNLYFALTGHELIIK